MTNLSKQKWFKILTIFCQEQSLHMTLSESIYVSMISKHHGIFWNLQDLLSICLERRDTPVHFAYRTASEGFMVTEKRAKLFCTSNFRNTVHWSVSPCLPSILEMSESKKRQLKLISTKSIPNYVLSQVIKKFVLRIVSYRELILYT